MSKLKNIFDFKLKSIFLSDNSPASKYLLSSIIYQKKNLSINLLSGLLNSILEGLSLSIIYLLVKLISDTEDNLNISSFFLFRPFPSLHNWLDNSEFKELFIFLIALALFAQILQSFFKYINLLSTKYIEAECVAMVTKEIFEKIFSFSYRCSSKFKVGDLSELVVQSPETIRYQIEQLNQFILSGVLALTYLFFLINLSPWLLLVIILIAFASRFIQKRIVPNVKRISADVTDTKVDISKIIVESFQGLRVIYSFGLVDYIFQKLYLKTNYLEKRLKDRAKKITIIEPFLSFIPIVFVCFISLGLVFLVDKSNIFPLLGTFVISIQRLNFRIIAMSNVITYLADNVPKIARLNYVFSNDNKEFRRINGQLAPKVIEKLAFKNISFSYDDEKKFNLSKLNFTLNKGEITAIVGPSGAGKSSIIDLIIGLYEPFDGEILLNGNSLSNVDLNSWQKKISIVSQDIFLFNTSIINNLLFGLPKISLEEVIKACKLAKADQFIKDLPMKYDTLIGERGFKLSGGQKQRLAIARALIKKSELLILDEATSALDSITEVSIQNNINKFKKDKITLIVAHRLSTIKNADKILVIDKGKILGVGSHEELIKRNDLYIKLWGIQKSV